MGVGGGGGGSLVIQSTPTIQQLVFLAKFYFWPKFPQKFPFFLYDLFLCSALLLRERDTYMYCILGEKSLYNAT